MGYNQSKPSQSREEIFTDLLDKMNLTDKYPQKLSLRDAMTIRQETLGTVHTTDQLAVLPYLVLQKMMICDQRCRSCLYKPTSDSTNDSGIELSSLHPVDCMLIILHCCDDILRHELFSKLSLCQLAIPFLLPSPTDNSVTFLLWAMRSLVKSWKRNRTGGKEHRIVDYQGPIVSFLRIGNSPSSKSEILNAVIGGWSQYFFNRRECEGGDCERNFVDGLVEMCCYLPSGKDTDPFTDAVIFLNLRGDAQKHTEQVEFLQTISFMSVVLIAKENINDDTMKALQSFAAATESGEIILLLDEEVSHTETNNTTLELLHQALPENRCIKVELKNKDMATIATEIRKLLRAKITNVTPEHFKSINDCYEAAYKAEFKVDEEGEDCKLGKWNANMVMEKLHSAKFNKDEILPLQGPSLWQQWAKHDKEQHCIEENKATSVTAQIDAEKMEIRKKQFNICTKLTPVMDSFIRFLLDKNAKIRRYFLQWLKLLLDDHSREILPKLLSKYQETRAQLSAASSLANQPEKNSLIKELTKKLKILREKLTNASFGLEHLFREMSQIYEASMDSDGYEVPQILKNKANQFCRVMAEIMDEGHALELMDGDASHVPTLWVLAVIEKLKAVCGKNAREKNGGKIFVLSVLGIQSTGKSTLLNTMFGLRFNVSAGRCTRGAYIQLLPLNNSLRQMIDCDYVLIVDTEGLRAPELQLEGLKHDNELATFVIGLADATIINIFGEGDLDDILQISLHSFICMRGKLEMNPSCVFVHQSFLSVTSRLDAMTQVIAKVENCEGQYNSFNQVIAFDEFNDVFYFPSLWKGDSPMAPVNIDYSESAQTLKTALLERKQTHRCSLETFKLRTKDLWSSVVQNMGYNQSRLPQSREEIFTDLLDKMNLTDKYPQKLSLRDAMTIRQETLGTVHTTDQLAVLPYLVLQKMMMCDQRCRSCLYKASTPTMKSKPTDNDSDSDSEWSNSDSDDMDENSLHPVDCMLIILHCCDDILRHELFSKLSLCQLAIPILLPNPTDNSVTFLLWAMRSLVKSWKRNRTGGKEHRIVDYQGPIVSFLRIGNSPSSKSQILNAVIGGGLFYFFNRRECEGGDCERNFVDGLVEMCCYLPSGKDTDPFTDAVIFLNLRGDAQQHPKQVEFLQKISFISVVLTVETSIDENSVKVLQGLSEAPGGIVLLLAEDKQQKKGSRSKNLDLIRQSLPKSKSSKMKLKSKNMATLSSELQQLLAEKLTNGLSEHFTAISNCYQVAKEAGIKIDEDIEDSVNGKQYAKTIMEKVHSVRFNEVKGKMLPLQGPSLWHQWAKNEKERHRHEHRKQETSVTEYNAQIDDKKMEIRKEQINRCVALTPVMDCFMESLLKTTANVRKYFLQWLKLFLDDHSRKILPELHNKYQETRDQLIALKEECQFEDNPQVRELKEKLKIKNEELINASFGLEHLFREMGQIYEARIDSGGYEVPQSLKDKANCLPQIMAEIMEEGHALELMDGDASHVPTLWVLAVIEKLKAVCGKNAREKNGGKIFVLSVLGIQSTGKSTLLNTMFGLRFNVSAGRCTRGAYIQLLPLNNSLRQMIDCDYVLIVDTEGLRAPELQLEGLKHDNELATFVISLADATIINIFGEVPGDLDDILQTSLHAFIRMRKIEMNPSCLFVHQNVPDVLASSKSKLGRQKFHSKLDNMTQAAAKVENCEGQYNSFNQVIDFDDCKDVFYFPSLWKGDPPMASVNIGYSESAQTLKTALLKLIHDKQTCRCYLEVFKLRVKSLWGAILQENFVFNFKNTLEVCAYDELDSQYAQWSWTLQHKMLEWEKVTKQKIDWNSKTEVTEVVDACLKEAKEMLFKTYEDSLEKMQSFFDISDYAETLSQWKHRTKQRVRYLYEKSRKQAENYCDHLRKNKLNSITLENMSTNCKSIEEMAHRLLEGRLSDDELDQIFEVKWKELLDDFQTKHLYCVKYPSDHEMETNIIEILNELLQTHSSLIIRNLSNKCFSQINHSLNFSIDNKVHLSPTKWCNFTSIGDLDAQLAAKLTDDYLSNARKYLDKIRDESKHFNPSFVYAVLQDLFNSVDDVTRPEVKSNFVFTPEYKVDIGLVVCAYALNVFKETTKKLKQENDPILKLNREKGVFLLKFKNLYKNDK